MKLILPFRLDNKSDEQNIIFFLITKSIYCWITKQDNKKKQVVLIIDETHRYINNNTVLEYNIQKYLELLIREGRKYNFSIIISSQCPSDIPSFLIGQCNSFMLHKIINQFDFEILKRFISNEGSKFLLNLKILSPQRALICGEAFPAPLIVKINDCHKLSTIVPDDVIDSWKN